MWTTILALVAIAALIGLSGGLEAQSLCKEACYRWCAKNRPTKSCNADCVGRPSCRTKGALRGKACYDWCAKNKPGNFSCLGDCDARK